MTAVAIFGAAVLLLTGLLFSEKRESVKGKLLTKPFLSLLFIITAAVRHHPNPTYYKLILAGLAFCLVGDVCLAIPGQKPFRAGLAAFLTGHVCYAFGFFFVSGLTKLGASLTGVLAAVAIVVFFWLQKHLGAMRNPVIAYICIISAMLCGASSILGDAQQALLAKTVVFLGAFLFYISDLFVARQRFIRHQFINRVIGLPLYYSGQFLIATSTGLIQ